MRVNELLEKVGKKVTCGCTEDSCSHCAGKHTLEEIGQKCSCCGNEIKEVSATNEGPMDNFDLTPQQREIVALGHILKTQAPTVKDDALSNAMARVGDELTSYGASFGPKNAKEVEKKSGVSMPVIKKLMSFAKKIQGEKDALKKDHKDGGLDDTNNTDDDYGDAAKADAFAKDKMGEDKDLLDPLKGAYGELFGEPEVSQIPPEETALLQAMEKYKDDPAGLKAWIMKDLDIRRWLATDGSYLVDIVKQRISETTSAGSVAAVAAPIGGMQSRQRKNANGTVKNALDQDNILSNGKKKSRKSSN